MTDRTTVNIKEVNIIPGRRRTKQSHERQVQFKIADWYIRNGKKFSISDTLE